MPRRPAAYPDERFARDEQAVLQPLTPRSYRSLVLVPPQAPVATSRSINHVAVERRVLGDTRN